MTTRVKGLKISQVPELKELTGDEMIPYQYNSTNGKIAVSTITDYVSVNVDPSAPSAEVTQLRKDVDKLTTDVNDLTTKVITSLDDINAIESDINTVESNVASILNSTSSLENSVNSLLNNVNGLLDDVDSLESFANTKGQPNGIASLGSDGKLSDSQLPNVAKGSMYREVTYTELKALADAGNLIPGTNYAITDYSCAYIMPTYDGTQTEVEYPATDFKYIICTAINNSTLSENVDIIRDANKVAIVEAKYSIDVNTCHWTTGLTTKSPKGVIYYLKDANGNEATYDFKHVKFRRWAITNITANTTADTGSNTNVSPFRAYLNSNSRAIEDNRYFVGSGDPIEKTLIPAIFEGTWRCGGESSPRFPSLLTNNGTGTPLTPFHSDYIKRAIKPYTDTKYPHDKYLSWQKDMYASSGVSYSGMATHIGGMSNVVVDPNDYEDKYTIDYNGEDGTELYFYDSYYKKEVPLAVNNAFIYEKTTQNVIGLCNTVIVISGSVFNSTTNYRTYIMDNKFIGPNVRNTFLFSKTDDTAQTAQMSYNVFGLKNNTFTGNLFIVNDCLNRFLFSGNYNLFIGRSSKTVISNSLSSVYFGYFERMNVESSDYNLLFGNCFMVKTTGGSKWVRSTDGEYWYDNKFPHDLYSNIMGPFQYSTIQPHCNSNIFKGVYNKGVTIYGSCLLNSYPWLAWGTTLGYGIGQGILFGNLIHTKIPETAFITDSTTKINNISTIDSTKVSKTLPQISETDFVCSYPADPYTIKNTITTVEHYPSTKDRHIIFYGSDNAWHISNWQRVMEGTAGISMLSSIEEDNNEVAYTLEDYREMHRDDYPLSDSNGGLELE